MRGYYQLGLPFSTGQGQIRLVGSDQFPDGALPGRYLYSDLSVPSFCLADAPDSSKGLSGNRGVQDGLSRMVSAAYTDQEPLSAALAHERVQVLPGGGMDDVVAAMSEGPPCAPEAGQG